MNWPALIAFSVLGLIVAAMIVALFRGMAQCASPEGFAGCCDCAAQGKPGPRTSQRWAQMPERINCPRCGRLSPLYWVYCSVKCERKHGVR